MRHAHRFAPLAAAAVLFSACDDSAGPVGPASDTEFPAIEIVSGNEQVGLAGQPLPAPLRVRVTDARGEPLVARTMGFSVRMGGGTIVPIRVLTDEDGIAEARWILGADGPQQVTVQLVPGITALFLAGITSPSQEDVVIVEGIDSDTGVLIDGESWLGPANDLAYGSAGPVVAAGDWRGVNADRNEVVVFSRRGPPRLLRDVVWTPEPDTLRVASPEPVDVPVTFWLVTAPFDERRAQVRERVNEATGIFLNQGVGVGIDAEYRDASAVTADVALDFTCDGRQALESAVGRVEGRINVYVVPRVDGSTLGATTCTVGADFIALARNTDRPVLAHQLGHTFGLDHPSGFQTSYDGNLMRPWSGGTDLTEGQVFRIHFDPRSRLNASYALHDPSILRACDPDDFTDACPYLGLEILPD